MFDYFTAPADRGLASIEPYLAANDRLVGERASIADIACYPWAHRHPRHKVDISQFENVQRWYDAIGVRPAVQKGMPTLGGINM